MHHPTDRIAHTTAFVTPVVEHWLEREIDQWVHRMKDWSDDPLHHERTLLPQSYISLPSSWKKTLNRSNKKISSTTTFILSKCDGIMWLMLWDNNRSSLICVGLVNLKTDHILSLWTCTHIKSQCILPCEAMTALNILTARAVAKWSCEDGAAGMDLILVVVLNIHEKKKK